MALPTRALGSNARVRSAFESTPGTVPAAGANWFVMPFVSHTLGEETTLEEDDTLGHGREMDDPTEGVKTNAGDIVVPVDARNFGRILKLFFGAPTTAASGDEYSHVFASGSSQLPSMSIEVGAPEVPAFSVNRGARGNQLRIAMARSGKLNATCSLICIGETAPVTATVTGLTPTSLGRQRFAQATGAITKDETPLGSVVDASFAFTNNLEAVESIQPDGRIEDTDPGMVGMGGTLKVRYKDQILLGAASTSPPTPIALTFGWTLPDFSLLFSVPRVFLPKPKKVIPGPGGIQVEYNWLASGTGGNACTVTLVNDVASYAS